MVTPQNRLLFTALILVLITSPCVAETVLLEFSSATCAPCRQMRPVVAQIKNAGYQVREIMVDREPQMAARFRVDCWPTFIVLNNGQETSRLVGRAQFAQLKEMLDRGGAQLAQPLNPTEAPIVPMAQANPGLLSQDLSQPRPGRVVSVGDPDRSPYGSAQSTANPFPQAALPQSAAVSNPASDIRRLIEATVKISINDPEGSSVGTGTLVDARGGEALILTCGHLFRSSEGKGPITVTLYQMGTAGAEVRTTLNGSLIHYDLKRDLALVSIRPDVEVIPVEIGTPEIALAAGAPVVSIGCNAGRNPTAVNSKISTVDRYQGYPNVEVVGAPVEGRSGGGLFDAQGKLIGVCYAADPQANEGLYASLPSIHQKLDEKNLTMVYQRPVSPVQNTASQPPAEVQSENSLAATTSLPEPENFRGQNVVLDSAAPRTPSFPESIASASRPPAKPNLNPSELAALEEIASRSASSEVICIIRPQTPGGKSEVITLQNISPDFVRALSQGAQTTTNPALASGQANSSTSFR